MLDIFKAYTGLSLPKNPRTLLKEILIDPEDKKLQELYCYFLALNADRIDGKKIYKKLDPPAKPIFVEAYNRAYFLLKVWSKLTWLSTGKHLSLPNLFLPQGAEKDSYYFYKMIFNGEGKRIEKRWKEILNLY